MTSDRVALLRLVERLRDEADLLDCGRGDVGPFAARAAADAIEQLERELAEALKALAPFAKAANNFDNMRIGNVEEWFAYSGMSDTQGGDRIGAITVGDLRRARAVYIVNGGKP